MWFFLVLFFSFLLHASEYISLFESDITIVQNGHIKIHEILHVHTQGITIQHGIIREFPTIYKDRFDNVYKMPFMLHNVLLNGQQVKYTIKTVSYGKKIYIGDPHKLLLPGNYNYEIQYSSSRQLGFFEQYDEFYWNVTGNGWRLPISKVIARIYVPKNIPQEKIKFEAYTGYLGDTEKNYIAEIINDVIIFKTTQSFKPYQGLTVVVTWPKGYIQEPTRWQYFKWFMYDNIHILFFLVLLIFFVSFIIMLYLRLEKHKITKPIIPLFYPPDGMLPGGVRFMYKMSYDDKVLAADIVNMAVQGLIKIEYEKGWFGGAIYTLKKLYDNGYELYSEIMRTLFKKGDTYTLQKSNRDESLTGLIHYVEDYYKRKYEIFFDFHMREFFQLQAIIVGCFFILIFLKTPIWFLTFSVFILELIIIMVFVLLRGYTKKGWDLYNQIEGFKLFLSITQEERLKIIGTPPDKTPELYETYLPYAIALDVEKAWSNQFAPMFRKMKDEGSAYQIYWYSGSNIFDIRHFATDIGSNFSSVISASTLRPGSSSGSGGKGSSGRGSGGGGGGGW